MRELLAVIVNLVGALKAARTDLDAAKADLEAVRVMLATLEE